MSRIFDDRSNRMSPSHSRKGGARYGYDVSSALIQGQPQSAGSVARLPAAKIEAVALDAVRRHIGPDAPADNTELITTYVRQIEVRRTEIAISLMSGDHASEEEKDKTGADRRGVRRCTRSHRPCRHQCSTSSRSPNASLSRRKRAFGSPSSLGPLPQRVNVSIVARWRVNFGLGCHWGRTGWGTAMDSAALHELIAQIRGGRARRSGAKGRIVYG
jgi:hypothetical protein